jgi:hypothetical protein
VTLWIVPVEQAELQCIREDDCVEVARSRRARRPSFPGSALAAGCLVEDNDRAGSECVVVKGGDRATGSG